MIDIALHPLGVSRCFVVFVVVVVASDWKSFFSCNQQSDEKVFLTFTLALSLSRFESKMKDREN